MARFVKGEVVIVPFPFSDLTQAKRRPALVVASLAGDADQNIILYSVGQLKSEILEQIISQIIDILRA